MPLEKLIPLVGFGVVMTPVLILTIISIVRRTGGSLEVSADPAKNWDGGDGDYCGGGDGGGGD